MITAESIMTALGLSVNTATTTDSNLANDQLTVGIGSAAMASNILSLARVGPISDSVIGRMF